MTLSGLGGVIFASVAPNSPAARAGLLASMVNPNGNMEASDLIVSVDGSPIKGTAHFLNLLLAKDVGDDVELTVFRIHHTGFYKFMAVLQLEPAVI